MMAQNRVAPYVRGRLDGELTLTELAALWGFGRTRTWELVTREHVIPFRQDRFRIYVRAEDAVGYRHEIKRGRPQENPQ